ncbi:MAG: AMP-binding protein [Promethearchaeia archaeon]
MSINVERDLKIGELIDQIAGEYSDVEAAIFPELRKTYKEFNEDIDKLAAGILDLGIEKGDRVAVWAQNRYEWMVAWFALPKIGAILIPLDHWYKANEAQYILSHSGSAAVVCTSDYVEMIEEMQSDLPELEHIIIMDKEVEEQNGYISMTSVMERAEPRNEAIQNRRSEIDPDDVTFILYTSGTTGKPKGAMLTHLNIVGNSIDTATVLNCTPDDKYLITVPFSHCFGCILAITTATVTGSSMIPLKDQNPEVALSNVEEEKATILHGTPTHFIRYIREYKDTPGYEIESLRSGIIAGAPCPPAVLRDIIDVLGVEDIVIGYGLTEASPIITLTTPDDSFEHRINSVGKPIPNIEVRIVEPKTTNPLPNNTDGELVVRGYNVMKGYYKAPEKTEEAIDEEGWLHTGDMAQKDDEGYYKITGRIKEMIIYGGVNVYPKAIEDYLLKNPKIVECSVVGVPDDEYGEVVGVAAVVEEGFTEQDLVDYCYGELSSPSVPRYVSFDVLIPLSGRGKVQKFKLSNTFEQLVEEGKIEKIVPTEVKKKKKAKK